MDGVCVVVDQEHNFHHYLSNNPTKKPFRDLEIPPRKLLTRRLSHQESSMEETLFQKFLPYNNSSNLDNDNDDDNSDPYSSDHFRMFEFKIRKCTRSRSHDWTDCPFAHPGEKACRRCPRRFNYSGTVCADFRRGSCNRGDSCEFAHGVFECWLHPSRYRTEACKDGKNCQRKICFFAHTPGQLRSLSSPGADNSPGAAANKHVNSGTGHCVYCRCHPGIHHANSPTSILDIAKLSPPASPPFSPAPPGACGAGGFSPVSRFSSERLTRSESCGLTQLGMNNSGVSYKNDNLLIPQSIKELMKSMKGLNMNSVVEGSSLNRNSMWMDSFINGGDDNKSLFAFSPGSGRVFPKDFNIHNEDQSSSGGGPDLDWVNDLLT